MDLVNEHLSWLPDDGGMARLIRNLDWSATPLGPIGDWPQSLKTIVNLMLSSPGMMSLVWGAEATHLYNDSFTELLRDHRAVTLGQSAFKTFARSSDVFAADIAAGMSGKSARLPAQCYPVFRNGQLEDAWFDVDYAPIRDETGAVAGVLWTLKEITAQVLAERALRESEDNYRHVVDLSPQIPWAAGPDGRIVMIGPRWFEMTGLTEQEALGEGWACTLHPDDRFSSLEAWRASVQTIRPIDLEHRLRMRDGYHRWFRAYAAPRFSADGKVVRWYGLLEDIHERKVGEERVREIQAELLRMSRFTALGEMASALAHELNQPLTAISAYLGACRELVSRLPGHEGAMVAAAVEQSTRQALRAGEIIRSLRSFVSRGESRRAAEKLPKLVEEACALALAGAREKGVQVRTDLSPEAPAVLVDRIQVQQVLLNLLRNAVEAMEASPRRELTIWSRPLPEGDFVEVAVSDTGPGLPADIAETLFRPFRTTKAHGMGVGLSICRTIVEAHGGRISAEPTPGGGTTFRFTIRSAARG